jgi:hypothetical protein
MFGFVKFQITTELWCLKVWSPLSPRKGFSHGAREVCFPSRLHPPYMTTCTLPRVRSAVVLRTAGDPRRIRSLQPVQPAVLYLTAGHRRRTHSLLPVQPAVLFTCGGCSQFLYTAVYRRTYAYIVSTIMDFMIRIMIDKIQDCTVVS